MSEPPNRRLVLEFTKMTGAGNDFIVLDNRFYHFTGEELSSLAKKLCPRRLGVGADGLLALQEIQDPALDFRMLYFNADGSRGSMCGNGARCLGRFARMTGMSNEPLVFEADAGRYSVQVSDSEDEDVILRLPPYSDYRTVELADISVEGISGPPEYIWTGTDHLVVRIDDVLNFPVATVGATLRHDTRICERGANVNFVQTLPDSETGSIRLRVRTFERGVEAETMACGTGAVASALSAVLNRDQAEQRVEVGMNGGVLTVRIEGEKTDPKFIFLEGPAEVVYRGTLHV